MSYSNKRYKRQEDDNNDLPKVFQRLGSSSRPTTTYPNRTQRFNEGGGLRIARYNSQNSNSSQHAYPDYSKISQLRDDAIYYSPNNEYVYNQPIQAPTNNFRFVRSDSSNDIISRPIISFLRDTPVSNQPQSPTSPSSYNSTHYNTHPMNNRRVINEQQQDQLYQEQQQQQQEEDEDEDDVQEQTYNDRINIDIAKKIRITASIPSSNMTNNQLDDDNVGSNINNNKQVLTPKRKITVTTPRKEDRSSSGERKSASKRIRQISPITRNKRIRSPSPLSESSYSRRPRRSSAVVYDNDEDIPFLHLKADNYIPNYAKEDNINNRLSGVKKFKDLGSYPPLGSPITESVSHNKVWKKPESSPLPLSKKFTPGVTKTVDVTRSKSNFNADNHSTKTLEIVKEVTTPIEKSIASVATPPVKPISTSTEQATTSTKVGTATVKPVTISAKPVVTTAKPITAPSKPDTTSSSKHTTTSVKSISTPNSSVSTPTKSVSTPAKFATVPTASVKPSTEAKATIGSPKKPVQTSTDTPVKPTHTSSKDKPEKMTETPSKPVSIVKKPIKLGTQTNKTIDEKKASTQLEPILKTKSRWDSLPSNYTNLEKQNNVADNNTTVYSDTSVSTVKHGTNNKSKDISKAIGSSVSQDIGIQKLSNEPISTPSNITVQDQDTLKKEQERIKQDERARQLLRQLSIDEREDVVMDIEPPPSRHRPAPILNIHNQCNRYQSPVTTILKEEPMPDIDINPPVENEQDSVYNSATSALQNTVDTIMGEFIGINREEEKTKHIKKLPDINTQESVLLTSANEQTQQLISPPVSSNTETPPAVLPTVVDKPKTSRLPAPWKVRMTDSGEIFYRNSVTGEITPTRPV